ncbi:uncharacterized protein LOC108094613 [Drosophila ficusphila]|uniref:uncharacterized protein LOC108094613 n=1 Tax=Drosophila ficusphila TaxID=30025 RepID=UPI0007E85BFF|nr:uncharacterized protein LOC108094613 [Drosophila ficusphila]
MPKKIEDIIVISSSDTSESSDDSSDSDSDSESSSLSDDTLNIGLSDKIHRASTPENKSLPQHPGSNTKHNNTNTSNGTTQPQDKPLKANDLQAQQFETVANGQSQDHPIKKDGTIAKVQSQDHQIKKDGTVAKVQSQVHQIEKAATVPISKPQLKRDENIEAFATQAGSFNKIKPSEAEVQSQDPPIKKVTTPPISEPQLKSDTDTEAFAAQARAFNKIKPSGAKVQSQDYQIKKVAPSPISKPKLKRDIDIRVYARPARAFNKINPLRGLHYDQQQRRKPGELVEPTKGITVLSFVREQLKCFDKICDKLIENLKEIDDQADCLNIIGSSFKLSSSCLKLFFATAKDSLSRLKEAVLGLVACTRSLERTFQILKEPKEKATGPTQIIRLLSMGLDILRKLRQVVFFWYNSKEKEADADDSEEESRNRCGTGRGADQQFESNFPRKRRNQEEDPRLIKYRRVDNSFPRFIPNAPAEDPIPNKSMAERERENQQHTSKRQSIFNPPVYTLHRVRNDGPIVLNPFDLPDDEENIHTFGATGGPSSRQSAAPSRTHPQLFYSDVVRGGQNGFGETLANGHPAYAGRRAPAQAEKSILTHEMERMEHEQYLNLIHTVAHNDSSASRFIKPAAPPLQRIDIQWPTWSSLLGARQSRPSPQPMRKESELSEYAKLINREVKEKTRSPAPPSLMHIGSINNSHASTISISESSSNKSSSDSSEESSSDSDSCEITEMEENVDNKKATKTNHIPNTDAQKQLQSIQKPARFSMSDSLHRRFANGVYLKEDFAEQFKAREARKQEEMEHLRLLAEKEAIRSTDQRRQYEEKLRESIFQYRIPHKPIFVIGGAIKPVEKKTLLRPLTEEDMRRWAHLMKGGPETEVIITKFNYRITRIDLNTFNSNNWLNDEVINFYMSLITERSEKRRGELPNAYAMNTFFVPRLLQNGHAGVKRWTRKVDLFAMDVIPVPVHCNNVHWCMAIIHMKNKTILYYDSMGKPNPTVLSALEAYLREESLDKRKQPLDTSDFRIESAQNIPQQLNGSDCGLFSCMFAEYISRDVPITFSQENMEYFRKKMPLEIAEGKLWL